MKRSFPPPLHDLGFSTYETSTIEGAQRRIRAMLRSVAKIDPRLGPFFQRDITATLENWCRWLEKQKPLGKEPPHMHPPSTQADHYGVDDDPAPAGPESCGACEHSLAALKDGWGSPRVACGHPGAKGKTFRRLCDKPGRCPLGAK